MYQHSVVESVSYRGSSMCEIEHVVVVTKQEILASNGETV